MEQAAAAQEVIRTIIPSLVLTHFAHYASSYVHPFTIPTICRVYFIFNPAAINVTIRTTQTFLTRLASNRTRKWSFVRTPTAPPGTAGGVGAGDSVVLHTLTTTLQTTIWWTTLRTQN